MTSAGSMSRASLPGAIACGGGFCSFRSAAVLGLVLGALIFCFTNLYVPLEKLHERNRGTLDRIQCEPQICDGSAIANRRFSTVQGCVRAVSLFLSLG